MAALDKYPTQTVKNPKARLPRYDENPYKILGPVEATAQFFGNADPASTDSSTKERGKRLIKTASVIASLGIGVAGVTEFAQHVLHNTETISGNSDSPAHIQSKH